MILYDHSTNTKLDVSPTPFYKRDKDECRRRAKRLGEVPTPLSVTTRMNEEFLKHCNGKEDLITKTVLEITCGEAPFLCNPYNVETGEPIALDDRTGILDYKLKAAVELGTEWIFKAFESVYGYDIDPDNVALARYNLLNTFKDYLGRKPTIDEYRRITEIISWNVFLMDGLTGLVPGTDKPALIRDWVTGETLEFRRLNETC